MIYHLFRPALRDREVAREHTKITDKLRTAMTATTAAFKRFRNGMKSHFGQIATQHNLKLKDPEMTKILYPVFLKSIEDDPNAFSNPRKPNGNGNANVNVDNGDGNNNREVNVGNVMDVDDNEQDGNDNNESFEEGNLVISDYDSDTGNGGDGDGHGRE